MHTRRDVGGTCRVARNCTSRTHLSFEIYKVSIHHRKNYANCEALTLTLVQVFFFARTRTSKDRGLSGLSTSMRSGGWGSMARVWFPPSDFPRNGPMWKANGFDQTTWMNCRCTSLTLNFFRFDRFFLGGCWVDGCSCTAARTKRKGSATQKYNVRWWHRSIKSYVSPARSKTVRQHMSQVSVWVPLYSTISFVKSHTNRSIGNL